MFKLNRQEKLFSKKWFKNYSFIVIGTFLVSISYVFFITPYKIIPGGVYGISIILHYLTEGLFSFMPEGLPIGMTALCFNIPLAIAAYKLLGPGAGPKTIVTFVLTSVFVDFLSYVQGIKPLVEGETFLSAIYGAVILGIGVAMIFKANATSAGTDVLARIITRYTKIQVGFTIIIVDSVVVLLGLIAFGDWKVPLYSWITIFVYGKVVDVVMQGISTDKAVFIISDKSQEIRDLIINDLHRGGTFFHGKGMYNNKEKEIIYTVASYREITQLREWVHEIDPLAFMTILEAKEILGTGFKPLKDENK